MDSNSQLLSNIEKDKEKPQEQKKDSSFSITTFVWRFFSVISWIFLVASSYEAYIHNTTLYTVHSRIYEVKIKFITNILFDYSIFWIFQLYVFWCL